MGVRSGSATTIGVVTGILFVAAAMIPNSHSFPLTVPLLGGALAAYLAGKTSSVSAGDGALLGAKAGAIGGLIFVLVGTPLTYLLVGSEVAARTREAGVNLPLGGFGALLLGLLIVAAIGFVLAVIGGATGALIFGRR